MKYSGFVGIIIFLFVCVPTAAYGCSCSPPPQIEEFKNAQAVLIGRFIETTDQGSKFRVVKSWKGAKRNKIIFLNVLIWDCGLEIKLIRGNEFLFYVPKMTPQKPLARNEERLFENDNPLILFMCGRSNSLEKAKEDIKNMDKIAAQSKNSKSGF